MGKTKRQKVKFAIKNAIVKTYGKAGYTTTADKFLRLFNKLVDDIYTTE